MGTSTQQLRIDKGENNIGAWLRNSKGQDSDNNVKFRGAHGKAEDGAVETKDRKDQFLNWIPEAMVTITGESHKSIAKEKKET